MLEIVVIGAGIAGCAAALALRERGAAVTVVDMGRPGGGATGASAGLLTAQYEMAGPSERCRLLLESRARYPAFVAKLEELSGSGLHVRWDGILVANFSDQEHEDCAEAARWQREAGLKAELLDPARAGELQPGANPAAVSYLWLPDEGQVDSQRLAAALGAAMARADVRLITGNRVSVIRSSNAVVTGVVMEDGRELGAERIVLAAGAWSGAVRGLPRSLPVRPIRGQILRYPAGALELNRPLADHEGRYLVPRADGTVLAGSTMEDVGFDRSITETGRRSIHDAASRLAPALSERRPAEQWAGLRPVTADSLPIIGPDPELEGLIYASGYGRNGILLAPLAASIVADLAVSGASAFDWRPFRPDRFARDAAPN